MHTAKDNNYSRINFENKNAFNQNLKMSCVNFSTNIKLILMSITCGIDISIVHEGATLSGFIYMINLTQGFVLLRPELLPNGALPLRSILNTSK
jgi:hypothetical protein